MTRPFESEHFDQEAGVFWGPERKWWVGMVNRSAGVVGEGSIREEVLLVDCTLREGEEFPGAALTVQEKLELAHVIAGCGFRELEVGYAGAIDEHFELLRLLRQSGPEVRYASHTRIYGRGDEWKEEIERSVEAGAQVLTFVGWATPRAAVGTPWLPPERVPERVALCIEHARSCGVEAAFGLADLVRTDLLRTVECYGAAVQSGAKRLYVYDGQGAATPEAVAYLTRLLRDLGGPDVQIGFHGHNTFGLACANALAAVRNGATVIDVVPLGLGDAAGIVAAEETVAALEVLYGADTGIDLKRLRYLCQRVGEALKVEIPPHKAIVGDSIYRHQIDSHVAAIIRGAWDSWEVIRPDVLGQERRLEFGWGKVRRGKSGAIGAKAEQMGIVITDQQIEQVIAGIRDVAKAKGFATEREVEQLIREVTGE